jgi:MFS family permease
MGTGAAGLAFWSRRGLRRPFYGWYIVATAWVALFVSAGSSGFTFSIFLPSMAADLGWSTSTIVAAASVSYVTGSLAGPFIGRIIDQRGARLVLTVTLLGLSLSCALTAGVTAPWELFVLYGLLGGVCRAALQNVAPGAMVAQWFVRRRPLAFGLVAISPPCSSLVLPPIIAALLDASGWRWTWVFLGAMTVALALAPVALVIRRRPEDMGLLPDGSAPPVLFPADAAGKPRVIDEGWAFSEAIRSRPFWMMATAFALILVAPSGSTVFMYPYFTHQGLAPATAAAAISVMSFFQVVSRLGVWAPVIAWLSGVRTAIFLWGGLLFAGTLAMLAVTSDGLAFVVAAFFGIAMGGNFVLQLQIWPEYFGRRAVGAIAGTAQLLSGFVAAAGPPAGAAVLDATGDFTAVYLGTAGTVLAGLVLMAVTRRPVRPAVR